MLLLLLLLFFFLMLVQYVKEKKLTVVGFTEAQPVCENTQKKKLLARTCQREKERSEMTTRAESQHTNRHNEI